MNQSTQQQLFVLKRRYFVQSVFTKTIFAFPSAYPKLQNKDFSYLIKQMISVMHAWIDNETFYKFMQFENLKALTIVNSEGLTIDYEEGVLPILQVIGANLENIILTKFESVNLVSKLVQTSLFFW